MKGQRLRSSLLVPGVVAIGILGMTGCSPTPASTLSPPIVAAPLYACATVVAYSGADRDAKIWIYVNGTKVAEITSWLGWGEATLPSALKTGDVVAAAQVVGSKISSQSRDPVTVVALPASELTSGKLKTPKVVPPLYECQRVVRVQDAVRGATVTVRNNGATVASAATPYTVVRVVTPELRAGDSVDARQQLCSDKPYVSDWSAAAKATAKPVTLPDALVAQPLVAGSDACAVDGLIPGAAVKIFADSGSGPVQVGGGLAAESGTIFRVHPAIDKNAKYHATQALCSLESKPATPVTPTTSVPPPRIKKPLCVGKAYVTVCDTVLMSTVRAYLGGTQVAQAAGNGGCVRMALGDATILNLGGSVTADQTVAGSKSVKSAAVTVAADGSPDYDPGPWNSSAHVGSNNCYNYGCDMMTDTFAQPGEAHGAAVNYLTTTVTCANIDTAAKADGLVAAKEKTCSGCRHLVALVIAPPNPADPAYRNDYHWYRKDAGGMWSHKPGGNPATNLDASGHPISNPETAERKYVYGPDYIYDYSTFCTYYCVDKDVVVIK